jgi:steroid delta-isomerase-like uncharacterized protein
MHKLRKAWYGFLSLFVMLLLTHCTPSTNQQMTLQQQNKAFFAKALDDFFNKRDISSADRNYLPTYIQHNEQVASMAKAQGLTPVEGMKSFFTLFFEAFPDYRVDIEYIGAEGDKVFAILNWEGTHQKDFMGKPATGKKIKVRTAEVMRIENGKFAEHWDVVDETSMLISLGSLTDNRMNH